MNLAILTFNPFQENTYVLYDGTKECIIIDPGCYENSEKLELDNFIASSNLTPVRLINTHCHIDHVFGNAFVGKRYGLELEIHKGELPVLEACPQVSQFYGIPYAEPSPAPGRFIEEGEVISFGNTKLETIFTPGHSPASISFFCREDKILIAGDVLFRESIGRTDLPGGDHATLISSIKDKLLPLGNEVKVYPGHGPATTIGWEKERNPFL
ncbi:MAG TPA: MBL fold metallo-hydrolase [Bacteroidetes bacterium]|nr:MBL fold metallo-hydrolase [Bacteroidota bacterium]